MNSISSSTYNAINEPCFLDEASLGYAALLAAAEGDLETLRKLHVLGTRKVLSEVQHVQVGNASFRYTPLHYAIANKRFACVAYLINEVVPLHVKSQEKNGAGQTAFELLSQLEKSLVYVLEAFALLPDQVNFNPWFALIADDQFPLARKQEVIRNESVRDALSQKMASGMGQLMMAVLLKGSLVWEGKSGKFHEWTLSKSQIMSFHSPINCSQFVIYAAILAKNMQKQDFASFLEGVSKVVASLVKDKEMTAALRLQGQTVVTRAFAEFLGYSDESAYCTKKTYKRELSAIDPASIYVFMMQEKNGPFAHFGFLYQGSVIHIDELSRNVDCQKAEPIFAAYFRTHEITKIFFIPLASQRVFFEDSEVPAQVGSALYKDDPKDRGQA